LCALCLDFRGTQTRRETPEVRSRARERVVTDYEKTRGPEGRYSGIDSLSATTRDFFCSVGE